MAIPVSGLKPYQKQKRKTKDMKDLERFCMEEWSKIPRCVLQPYST